MSFKIKLGGEHWSVGSVELIEKPNGAVFEYTDYHIDNHDDIEKWLRKSGIVNYRYEDSEERFQISEIEQVVISPLYVFESAIDAVRFKLRWG